MSEWIYDCVKPVWHYDLTIPFVSGPTGALMSIQSPENQPTTFALNKAKTCRQRIVPKFQVANHGNGNLKIGKFGGAKQRRIVTKINELLELCDELETRQTAARELGAKILDSLIHHTLNPKK